MHRRPYQGLPKSLLEMGDLYKFSKRCEDFQWSSVERKPSKSLLEKTILRSSVGKKLLGNYPKVFKRQETFFNRRKSKKLSIDRASLNRRPIKGTLYTNCNLQSFFKQEITNILQWLGQLHKSPMKSRVSTNLLNTKYLLHICHRQNTM